MKSQIPQYYKSTRNIEEKALSLRKKMTPAEQKFWRMVRNRNFYGLKFRRQHHMDIYIADFYCDEFKFVVEIDGEIHDREDVKAYDRQREFYIKQNGIKLIRFTNSEVLTDLMWVRQTLKQFLKI